MEQELGMQLPEEVRVVAVEETADTVYLVFLALRLGGCPGGRRALRSGARGGGRRLGRTKRGNNLRVRLGKAITVTATSRLHATSIQVG